MADTSEQLRKLADLFLTRRDSRDDAAVQPSSVVGSWSQEEEDVICEDELESDAQVECIVVGHLPVRAGLWLTQYADDVAREDGPTALIRLDADQYILEVLRGDATVAGASSASTLRSAVAAIAPHVRRWVIRPELGPSSRSIVHAQPDWLTILSGADEIAVVAAYRIIKDLYETAQREEMPLPPIEIAILGADVDLSRRAASKIAATAREALDLEVPLARSVQAMGPLGSTLHFRFPSDSDHELATLIETIRRPASFVSAAPPSLERAAPRICTLATPLSAADEAPARSGQPSSNVEHPLRSRPRSGSLTTQVDESPFGFSTEPRADLHRAAEARAAQPQRLRPKPSVHVEPKRIVPNPPMRQSPKATALASWVGGVAILPVRCPDANEIEIAVDTGGRFHLIGWDEHFRDISLVETWLRKHVDLIRMACSDYEIAAAARIERHIFTSEPVRVADLHGSGAHLHVLAPVEVEGKCGWYSALLSA